MDRRVRIIISKRIKNMAGIDNKFAGLLLQIVHFQSFPLQILSKPDRVRNSKITLLRVPELFRIVKLQHLINPSATRLRTQHTCRDILFILETAKSSCFHKRSEEHTSELQSRGHL